MVFSRTEAGQTNSFLRDGLGSTLSLLDSTGATKTSYAYDPFGNTSQTGAASNNSTKYTGREDDGTGLYYYRARYYSPTLQRFISQDPIGFRGGVNFYAYVGNNPTNFTDPSGTQILEGAAIGAGGGFAVGGPPGAVLGGLGGIIVGGIILGAGIAAGIVLYQNYSQNNSMPSSPPPMAGRPEINTAPSGFCPTAPPGFGPIFNQNWPNTAQEMDNLLGFPGTRVPDGPNTPGRDKVVWNPSDKIKITLEQHPYHPNAPTWHRDPHWHLDTPAATHDRFVPGDPMP